jgi:hypothetical protein
MDLFSVMLPIGPNTGTKNTDTSSNKFCEISQSPPCSTHTKPLLQSSTTTHKCLKIFIFSCSRWTTELWWTIFPLMEMLWWNNSICFKCILEWYVVRLKCNTICTMWHWNKISLVVSFNKAIVTISWRNVLVKYWNYNWKKGVLQNSDHAMCIYINVSIGTPNYNTMCMDVHGHDI